MDLVKMIQTELLKYYVEKEFQDEKPLPKQGFKHRKNLGLTNGGFGLTIDA
jgi:hypothetical protein